MEGRRSGWRKREEEEERAFCFLSSFHPFFFFSLSFVSLYNF